MIALTAEFFARECGRGLERIEIVAPAAVKRVRERLQTAVLSDGLQKILVNREETKRKIVFPGICDQLVDHAVRISANRPAERGLFPDVLPHGKGIVPDAEPHIGPFLPHQQRACGQIAAQLRPPVKIRLDPYQSFQSKWLKLQHKNPRFFISTQKWKRSGYPAERIIRDRGPLHQTGVRLPQVRRQNGA